jgi:hypothetical protein
LPWAALRIANPHPPDEILEMEKWKKGKAEKSELVIKAAVPSF